MPDRLEILPVRGLGEITPGTDLAAAIHDAAPWLRDLDVLVVTSKIISKAEGQLVDVPVDGPLRDAARDDILTAQTARVVATRGPTRIVQTHHGFVMAAAGIDASNVDPSRLVLLPKDPDASARALRAALLERFGLDVAVIVSDTMGRPWRVGLTDVALGAAGIPAIVDYRGERDPYGNEMHLTQMAIIDELSGAAELVKGKFDQVPVGVVRGFLTASTVQNASTVDNPRPDGPGARALIREAEMDLFAMGTAEARADGLARAANLTDPAAFARPLSPQPLSPQPLDPQLDPRLDPQFDPQSFDVQSFDAPPLDFLADDGALDKNVTAVARVAAALATAATTVLEVTAPPPDAPPFTSAVVSCTVADSTDAAQLIALGIDVHRLRCALAAESLATMPAAAAATAVRLFVGLA